MSPCSFLGLAMSTTEASSEATEATEASEATESSSDYCIIQGILTEGEGSVQLTS